MLSVTKACNLILPHLLRLSMMPAGRRVARAIGTRISLWIVRPLMLFTASLITAALAENSGRRKAVGGKEISNSYPGINSTGPSRPDTNFCLLSGRYIGAQVPMKTPRFSNCVYLSSVPQTEFAGVYRTRISSICFPRHRPDSLSMKGVNTQLPISLPSRQIVAA